MRVSTAVALAFAAVASAQSTSSSAPASGSSSSAPATTSVAAQGPDPRFSGNVLPIVAKLDACALPCFTEYVPQVCPKGIYDFYCQCSNTASLTPLIQPCIVKNCPNIQTQLHVQQITNQICNVVRADVISWNDLSPTQQAAYTSKGTNSLVSSFSDIATSPAPTAYTPNAGKAMATAVPLVGAGLAVLAFAL